MRSLGKVTLGGVEKPATNETLFVIMSATKAIVASCVWLLMQEGKLDPGERVADIVPEFGTNGKEVITVDQLLSYTSGFPNAPYAQKEWLDRGKRLERFAKWRLEYEPDEIPLCADLQHVGGGGNYRAAQWSGFCDSRATA